MYCKKEEAMNSSKLIKRNKILDKKPAFQYSDDLSVQMCLSVKYFTKGFWIPQMVFKMGTKPYSKVIY